MDNIRKFEPLFGEWSVEAVIAEDDDSRTYRVFRERDGKREYAMFSRGFGLSVLF